MRTVARTRHPSQGYLGFFIGALFLGVLGTCGTLWAVGMQLPWFKPAPPSMAGLIPVPVLAQEVPAYTRLTREHFFSRTTGKITYVFLLPSEVRPEMIRDLGQLFGRVLTRDKREGYALTETDLLPPGTRPGIVAGIPAGKRSMVLDASAVRGLHGLAAGDHFDLIATVELPAQPQRSGNKNNLLTATGGLSGKTQRTQVLVQDGIIVRPVTTREAAKGAAAKAARGVYEEVTIAVAPTELVPLTEALAKEADVVCVARSGLPNDPGTEITTDMTESEVRTIETMVGFERQVHLVPDRPRASAAKATDSAPDTGT